MERSLIFLCLILFFSVLSCEPEPPPTIPPPPPGPKLRPVAIAGEDRTVALSDAFRFQVNGNLSYNPARPHNISSGLTMNWKQLGGPEPVEFRSNGVTAEFIPGNYGAYSFELTVRNEYGEAKDSITVTVVPGSCNPNLEYVKAEFREESVYNITVPKDAGACVAAGRLIFAGGDENTPSKEIHIYDIAAKSWKTAFLPGARLNVGIGANKDFAFITGQGDASDEVDMYEFYTGNITTIKLSQPRVGVSVTIIGNKAVFAGGFDARGMISSTVDIYDMDNKAWSIAKFDAPRYKMVSTVVGNKIYFSGGFTSDWDISNRLDVYDMSSGQWTTSRLKQGRANHSATLGGNKIVFTGGYKGQRGDFSFEESMEWLDLSTATAKQECLFGEFLGETYSYAWDLASVFVGQNLYSCYNQSLTRFDVAGNKWMISKGLNDRNLAGFFSDGNRLLAISTKSSGTEENENRENISIYEVKF